MKNKSILAMSVFAVCVLAAVPANAAEISGDNPETMETISYIVDFLDDDGNILDSRICTYGDVLEDIQTPKQKEDDRYIYQFAGWEPQIQEVVTESALYTAVYQRISKADGEVSDIVPEIPEEIPAASVSENFYPEEEAGQVSSTSYDVIPFHIEEEKEIVVFPEERKIAYRDETANSQMTVLPEEGEAAVPEEPPADTASEPVVLAEMQSWTQLQSPAEIPAPAQESADAAAEELPDAETPTVYADKSEPEIFAKPKKTAAKKENKAEKKQRIHPMEIADTKVSAQSDSRQETAKPFSVPVFLAGAAAGSVVYMKGRKILWEK